MAEFLKIPAAQAEPALNALLADGTGGLALVQGESGSGKTRLIKRVLSGAQNARTLSVQELTEIVVGNARCGTMGEIDRLFQYHVIAMEDVDLMKDKEATQQSVGHLIAKLLSKGIHVLMTGTQLEERAPALLKTISTTECRIFNISM